MITVLDSGVGGLSILKHIKRDFPGKKLWYFADSANFPYGEKSKDELIKILDQRVGYLVDNGAKLVVIACNTATISAISELRTRFKAPIIGIEPAVKPAIKNSNSGRIGLIATESTISNHNSDDFASNICLIKRASKDLATQIEDNLEGITDEYIKSEFGHLISKGVDTVVLGCTHYHFISDRLKELYPGVDFIAPEKPILDRISNIISDLDIQLESGGTNYFASKNPEKLYDFIKKIGLENDPVVEFAE